MISLYQRSKSSEVILTDKYNIFVGVGRLLYISHDKREISDVYIIPECRGWKYKSKKISNIIMETLLKLVTTKVHNIYLEVHSGAIPAIKLYEKYSFVKVRKSKTRRDFLKPLGFKKTMTMVLN